MISFITYDMEVVQYIGLRVKVTVEQLPYQPYKVT